MGQKCILLGFVEAMHFIYEQHRALAMGVSHFSFCDRLTDILYPSQHCGQIDPVAVRLLREQTR